MNFYKLIQKYYVIKKETNSPHTDNFKMISSLMISKYVCLGSKRKSASNRKRLSGEAMKLIKSL